MVTKDNRMPIFKQQFIDGLLLSLDEKLNEIDYKEFVCLINTLPSDATLETLVCHMRSCNQLLGLAEKISEVYFSDVISRCLSASQKLFDAKFIIYEAVKS